MCVFQPSMTFFWEKNALGIVSSDSDAPGVVDAARGFGVAKSLLRKTMDVIRGELPQVQAIWVHVISYNEPVTWYHSGKVGWFLGCHPLEVFCWMKLRGFGVNVFYDVRRLRLSPYMRAWASRWCGLFPDFTTSKMRIWDLQSAETATTMLSHHLIFHIFFIFSFSRSPRWNQPSHRVLTSENKRFRRRSCFGRCIA